ncbi:MAG: SDR family oxidoreductase [Actinomycetia bacterium]|nr:SDR family oxidoreductase [Actinomycetes bacterium]
MSDPFDFTGRVALVTGAGQGIGRATALRLAAHGARVAVNDRSAETAERTAREIQTAGGEAVALPADVSTSPAVDDMFARFAKSFDRLDFLVNNAGISLYRSLLDCTEEDWDAHIDIMAKGTFLTMRHAARMMIAQKFGRIVNLGSYVAQLNCTTKYFGPYCAAKFGIIGLTQVAAQEWAPHVNVNAVGPGDVATDMMELEWEQEGARRGVPAAVVKDEYRRRLILAKFEEADDLAQAIMYLCSPLAAHVTGAHFIVSGGLPYKAEPGQND